jgi:hypothetical protein
MTIAGYSQTPLTQKLGIKSNTSLSILSAPTHFFDLLQPLPERVQIVQSLSKPSDITEDDIQCVALEHGVVDVKVIAIDEQWSGLKIVHRVKNR